ncbi:MAG: polyphosphate polymerase domain-containing protein [Marinilabiliaceae bacterium]|nr:polyphosphate polymerase domain-containing protein [Marinilabiliaceae bacterium]
MVSFANILNNYRPVSLKEMDSIQLMNRTDTKFVFNADLLPELLALLQPHYRILEIDDIRDFPYHTTYLDTTDYHFFYQHMSSRPGRYKVRYRQYEATGGAFLEVKLKNRRNRTIKWRISSCNHNALPNDHELEFLNHHVQQVAAGLHPVLENRFQRITLAGLNTKERITIDYHLSFRSPEGSEKHLPFLAILELKREGFTGNTPVTNALKSFNLHPTGFSKYCIGSVLVRNMDKKNILKSKLLLINKLHNESTQHSFA